MQAAEFADERPVFIVGVGRSGTSLVQSMLAAHPLLAIPPETNFIRRYLATAALNRTYRRGGVDLVGDLLESDGRIGRLGLDLREVVSEATSDGLSEARLYTLLLKRYAEQQGKPRWGDKDPRSVEYLPLLAHYWPKAYVVHVLRDPRDVLASKKRAAWSRHRTAAEHIFAHYVQSNIGRRFGNQLFGPRYIEIQYEHLIAGPKEQLIRLMTALGLDFTPEMLNFGQAAQRLVAPEEMAWKKETLGALKPDNVGKWKDALTAREVALVEAVCRSSPGSDPNEAFRGKSGWWFADWAAQTVRATGAVYQWYRKRQLDRLLRRRAA